MFCFDDIHSIWNRNKDKFTITFIIESISEWWICHTRFQLCCISLRLYWPSESCFLMVTSLVRRKSQNWPRFSEATLKAVGNESHWSAKTDSKSTTLSYAHLWGYIAPRQKKSAVTLHFLSVYCVVWRLSDQTRLITPSISHQTSSIYTSLSPHSLFPMGSYVNAVES